MRESRAYHRPWVHMALTTETYSAYVARGEAATRSSWGADEIFFSPGPWPSRKVDGGLAMRRSTDPAGLEHARPVHRGGDTVTVARSPTRTIALYGPYGFRKQHAHVVELEGSESGARPRAVAPTLGL